MFKSSRSIITTGYCDFDCRSRTDDNVASSFVAVSDAVSSDTDEVPRKLFWQVYYKYDIVYIWSYLYVADISGRCSLCSGTNRLVEPPFRLSTVGSWAFSGCRCQDLERTAGQSRLHNVVTVVSAPSEDIFVPAIFLVALQWT